MKVSAQYAAAHIADLFLVASNGEEVEIALPDRPALKLVVATAAAPVLQTGRRILGAGRGDLLRIPPVEEWAEMDEMTWQQPERPRSELFGSLAGQAELGDDWDSPETNKEIQDLFEGSEAKSRS